MGRKLDGRALVDAFEGRGEPPVPVYQFSGGRVKYEHANHNPFEGLDSEGDDDENNNG